MINTNDKGLLLKSIRMMGHGTSPEDVLDKQRWADKFNIFSSATGDNRYFNTLPQFGPATDPRPERAMESKEGGMGTMYKRMYDDNAAMLTLVPGVPEFLGILNYVANLVDGEAAIMARTGRTPSLMFYLGQAAGSIAFFPLQMASVSLHFLEFLFNTPNNSFYSLRQATGMHMMTAQGLLNDIMIKLGYIDPVIAVQPDSNYDQLGGRLPGDQETTREMIAGLQPLYGDAINSDGTIDIMKLLTKGSRKYNYMMNQLAILDEQAGKNEEILLNRDEAVRKQLEKMRHGYASSEYAKWAEENVDGADVSGTTLYAKMEMDALGRLTEGEDYVNESTSRLTRKTARDRNLPSGVESKPVDEFVDKYDQSDKTFEENWFNDVKELLGASFHYGMNGVTFKVNNEKGSVSDSFSNSAGESPLADKFNSMASQMNQLRFSFAGGDTGIGIVDALKNQAAQGIQGVLSGSVIGNVPLALANAARIKMPKHWESYSSSLHRESYTIDCRCTYAHPYEQVTKIWSVFAMILPMVAGFSTGANSHGAPFMVSAYCKGRTFIRTGMIESATFTFGEGDAGWTRERNPLNMKVDLTIVDLDPLVNVPVKRGISLLDVTNPSGTVKRILNDDVAYNDYLSRLTAVDYMDTILRYRRLNHALTSASLSMQQSLSAQNVAAKLSDSIVGDIGRIFTKGAMVR